MSQVTTTLRVLGCCLALLVWAEGASAAERFSAEQANQLQAIRGDMAQGLGGGRPAEAMQAFAATHFDVLLRVLEQGPVDQRELAAFAMGFAPSGTATAPLAKAMREDASVEVRRTAAQSLLRHPAPEIVDALAAALQDPDDTVRRFALLNIKQIAAHDPTLAQPAFDAVLNCAQDPSWRVRMYAALVLGALGDPRADTTLALLFVDEHPLVRQAAAAGQQIRGEVQEQLAAKEPEEGEGEQEGMSGAEFLSQVADIMEGVEKKLGDARAGEPVQRQQKEIVQRLDHLISQLEKASGGGQGQQKKQQQQQRRQSQQKQQGGPNNQGGRQASSPMAQSSATSGQTTFGSLRAQTEGAGARWGDLPDRAREGMSHEDWEKMPPRYRQLISDYYRRTAEDAEE